MSWKYSTSYPPRDRSLTRDNKYGYSSSGRTESPGRFYRSSGEPVEHSPVWAKSGVADNPASVQRLKERYNISEDSRRDIRAINRTETKELPSPTRGRPYGRSFTTLSLGNDPEHPPSKYQRSSEKTPEPKSGYGSYEGRSIAYMPSATAKLIARKYSNDLSPTSPVLASKPFAKVEKSPEENEDVITVVTRGTSPTPTTSTVYLRSKRTDFGLEKKVAKPRKKPDAVHKEVQTDREEVSLSKYSKYTESSPRTKHWTPSYSPGSSYGSKFSGRFNYDQLSPSVECRRSTSQDESDEPRTPDSPRRTLSAKPPAPTSPIRESDKKSFVRKSPPSNFKSSFKLDCAKSESTKTANSPTQISSPTKTETLLSPTKFQSPKVTIDPCPDVNHHSVEDASSASESSEEETTSEEEADEMPADPAAFVKKSVTNFLQNIPNNLAQSPSRAKVNTLSPQRINFRKIESGERAWWMEDSDLLRTASTWAVSKSEQEPAPAPNNFLSPPYLVNRQFSRDKDWLRGSSEDLVKATKETQASNDGRQKQMNGEVVANGLMNGDHFHAVHFYGNCHSLPSSETTGETNSDVNPVLRRREKYSKSPDNFLAEDSNSQMKFNQQSLEGFKEDKNYLTEFPRECSIKDFAQKLQNGLGSPLEERNFLEPGDMSGMISKAKAGLAKSKTKLDVKKSSSREMSPKIVDPKSEIDLYWKELADSMNRPLRLCDLDFTDLNTDDETDVFGNLKTNGEVPPPPPMLILPVPGPLRPSNVPAPPANATPPPHHPAPARVRTPAPPPVPQIVKNKKTVKLFWKEVKDEPAFRAKIPNGPALIWDELTAVKVDTQKLEHLFESRAKDLMSKKQQDQNKNKEIIVLDPKRSNAINIGMTKLPPPRAIKAAILKMDSTVVNKEGIEKLLTMLPTEEEKLRIQEAQSGNPDVPLGSAEQFLLTLASINELEARLRLWAFKLDFENSEKEICEPLMDLKQGMDILRANKTFRGILSTLLSVGNFLNGYDVKGFQIEYLSKVPEVKDTVHKHSLLHHLCVIVMEKFPDSTDLYSEIGAVTRASKVDFDELAANIKKLEEDCKLSWNYLKMIAKHEGHTAMKVKMSDFLADCAERIIVLAKVHKRVTSRFQKFAFWLGVPTNRISTTRPNEIFKIISEFALEYRTTRDRVLQQIKKMNREKSRTRGYLYGEDGQRKMNSKEAKDDAKLKQLLGNDLTYSENFHNASTWRRQRKDTKNLWQEMGNEDEEILETLIKTANQVPATRPGLRERRRSRVYGKHCKSRPQKKAG